MAEIFFVMFNPHAGWNVGAFYRPFRCFAPQRPAYNKV